jgi:hypothetical protein
MNQKEKDFHVSHHQAMAQHCSECAKAESQCAVSHEALAEHSAMTAPEVSKHHSDLAEAHKDKASSYVAAGENHLKCCKSLEVMDTEKAGESSDLKIILAELQKRNSGLPSGLSALPRFDNPHATLVPRTGQPTQTDHEAAKAQIDPVLEPIVYSRDARG